MSFPLSPTPSRTRHAGWRADVQGLRAIAVLAVMVYHAGLPLPGGFTGVDMFFVISGYVITEMLLREWHSTGRIRLGQFYLRRFKRLVPALATVVVVTVVLAIVLVPPLSGQNRALFTGIGAMLFGANVVVGVLGDDYFNSAAQSNPLLHTWSLSVEEQFYFAFPLLLLFGLALVGKRWGFRRGAALVVGAVVATTFTIAVIAARIDLPAGELILGFYSPIARAWEFGVGALVALASPILASLPRALGGIAGALGTFGVVLGFVLVDSSTPFPGVWALLPVMGTALMIAGGTISSGGVLTRGLGAKPMSTVGDWSYSLFLWHWPFVVFSGLIWTRNETISTIAVFASVVPAVLSYYLLEQPFRRVVTASRASTLRLVAGTLSVPALVLSGSWIVAVSYLTPLIQQTVGNPLEESAAFDNRCLTDDEIFSDEWAKSCTFNAQAEGAPIYLVGDSNAAHFDEGVIAAGRALNRPVTIVTGGSCEPIEGFRLLDKDGEDYFSWCPSYREFLFDYLDRVAPGSVVMGFTDFPSWFDDRYYSYRDATMVSGTEMKADLLARALEDTVTSLQSRGHDVALTQAIPQFQRPKFFLPEECHVFELLDDRCGVVVPREDTVSIQQPNRDAIFQVAERTGAVVLDLQDVFCDEKLCSPSNDGYLLYRDDTHISAETSRSLTSTFVNLLK